MDYSILCLLHFPGRPTPMEADVYDERSTLGSDLTVRVSGRGDENPESLASPQKLDFVGSLNAMRAANVASSAADDDSDDDEDVCVVSSLGLPKLTEEDLAAA